MERWLRDIEDYLVASDRFEEEIDGKNFDLIRKALDRMKPKKPKKPPIEEAPIGRNFYRICPSCGHEIGYLDIYDFCRVCGQALDWSE